MSSVPVLPSTVRFKTPRRTVTIEVQDDYMVIASGLEPDAMDWDMAMTFVRILAPAWPFALGEPELCGDMEVWTCKIDRSRLASVVLP